MTNIVDRCISRLYRHLPMEKQAGFINRAARQFLFDRLNVNPQETRRLLKSLIGESERNRDFRPLQILIPSHFAKLKNHYRFITLARGPAALLSQLIDKSGRLNFGIGAVHREQITDQTSNIPPRTLESEIELIKAAIANKSIGLQTAKAGELENRHLFRALLRARVEIYSAGRNRSSAAKKEDPEAARLWQQRLLEIASQLYNLCKIFPHSESRINLMRQISKAADLLNSGKPLADSQANAVLAPLTGLVEKQVSGQTERRVRAIRSELSRQKTLTLAERIGRKYFLNHKGNWQIIEGGFGKSESVLWHQIAKSAETPTAKLLSRINHQLENIEEELAEVREIMDTAGRGIAGQEVWAQLYGHFITLKNVQDYTKLKAQIEIEAACDLLKIGDPAAINFAKYLLKTAKKDLSNRGIVLVKQQFYLTTWKSDVEEHLAVRFCDLSRRIAYSFNKRAILTDPEILRNIYRELGFEWGAVLQGDQREEFLKRAKWRIGGVMRELVKAGKKLKEKEKLFEEIIQIKQKLQGLSREEWRRGEGASKKEEAKGLFNKIESLNAEIAEILQKAAEFILLIEHETSLRNSKGYKTGKEEFLKSHRALIQLIATLDNVDIIDQAGNPIGRMLRSDFEKYKEFGFKSKEAE